MLLPWLKADLHLALLLLLQKYLQPEKNVGKYREPCLLIISVKACLYLIEKIVNNKISDNLLINADITFREISMVKKVLKTKLKNIYHTRVEYPK